MSARLDGEPEPARSGHGWHCKAWMSARPDGEPEPARSGHGWHCGRETAGEGTRTLDIQLGKLALYQLSYARNARFHG